jgi:hypothetical protein
MAGSDSIRGSGHDEQNGDLGDCLPRGNPYLARRILPRRP